MVRATWSFMALVLAAAGAGFSSDVHRGAWQHEVLAARDLFEGGWFEEAHTTLRRLLMDLERSEHQSARTIVTLNNLGNAAQALGRYREAEGYYCRAIRSCEKSAQCRNESLARQLNNLSSLYLETERYEKAERTHRQALAILVGNGRPDPAELARNEEIAAAIAWARKRPAQAAVWNRRALASWRNTLGPTHPRIAGALNNLGVASLKSGDFTAAGDLLGQAVAMWETTSGSSHPGLAEPLLNLARLYFLKREPDRAGPLISRALAIAETSSGVSPRTVGHLLVEHSEVLRRQGLPAEAQEAARRGHAMLDRQKRELGRSLSIDVSQLLLERSRQ